MRLGIFSAKGVRPLQEAQPTAPRASHCFTTGQVGRRQALIERGTQGHNHLPADAKTLLNGSSPAEGFAKPCGALREPFARWALAEHEGEPVPGIGSDKEERWRAS